VPAPGLFIADEPVEPRPPKGSFDSTPADELTRLRAWLLVLGGLLLILSGRVAVMLFRRADANAHRAASAQAPARPPAGCSLFTPPSRISPIERSVPISALPLPDGSLALAIAEAKNSVVGWIYDPLSGEILRRLQQPSGSGEVSHVSAGDPPLVDRSTPDFAFAQTLGPGLALGVGPVGILRRGADGATGTVWPLEAGVRVTAPRAAAAFGGYFVAFRQGGPDGRIVAGWLKADGTAAAPLAAIAGAPASLGTPTVAVLGAGAVVLFSARGDKSEPYRVFASTAAPYEPPSSARVLDLPSEGGGALAPSITALDAKRTLVQWTDGNVGQYQVHVRLLDGALNPLSEPLLVSPKGANAGQGIIVSTSKASLSLFIQTTAGHDELWGVALSCH